MNVKFRALFSVLLLAAASALSLPAQETLRIATFNNQYENKVHPWADRADRVYRLIEAENWDIVGMQEPFWNQMADMDAKLTQYGWIGNSTDGKIEDGYWHYNPIFYRKARLEMLDWGRFWFSETPDVPGSKSWDSHTSRFCVWGHFRDRVSGRDFYHFNVHYDHKGETARRESSRLLLARIAAVAAGKPYFVTGDFNTEEGTPAYDMLVGAGTVLTTEQVDRAVAAGAKFIVSPGLNPKVVKYCVEKGIPVCPGTCTPSEMEQAMDLGRDVVKFFPAEPSGGVKFIKAVAAPYTMLKFMPTGGVNATNVRDYLAYDKILCCGGSWMVKGSLIEAGEFDKIVEMTKEAAAIVKEVRG